MKLNLVLAVLFLLLASFKIMAATSELSDDDKKKRQRLATSESSIFSRENSMVRVESLPFGGEIYSNGPEDTMVDDSYDIIGHNVPRNQNMYQTGAPGSEIEKK